MENPKPNHNPNKKADSQTSMRGGRSFGRSRREVDSDEVSADLVRKTPPHSAEAEQAVLGGIFIRGKLLHTIIDILREDDFYFPKHRVIFRIFLELYSKNIPIDLVSVHERLKSLDMLEESGGTAYLTDLAEGSIVSAANAVHHAHIVRNKAVQRELITASLEIISNCYDYGSDVEGLLEGAEQTVFHVSQRMVGSTITNSKQLVDNVFEDLTRRYESQEPVTGVHSGYPHLDDLTSGFQPSDLIIVAGRPAMGKTAFSLNVAMRAAVQHEVPTVIFSLEMSMEQLMQRMLSSWSKVDLKKLRSGFRLNDGEWNDLYQAADHLSAAPIFIDDTPALSTLELRARCRRLKSEKNLGLVVVDYLQLMRPGSRRVDSREQEISEISRNLKALAKEIHVPVIALSQLNRKVEDRGDKRPLLSDLRESGAIEQDADVIIFLYRDEVYNKREDNPKTGLAEVIIGKQRNGPTGVVQLAFLKESTAFEPLEERYTPPSEEEMS